MHNYCNICLKTSECLKSLDEIDNNNIKIITKLKTCIPKINWKLYRVICTDCSIETNNIYKFYQLCMDSYLGKNQDNLLTDNAIKIEKNPLEGPETGYTCNQLLKVDSVKQEGQFKDILVKQELDNGKIEEELIKNVHNIDGTHQTELLNDIKTEIDIEDTVLLEGPEQKKEETGNVCQICGASFKHKYVLNRHVKGVHGTEKKYKCEFCDRKFTLISYLNMHKQFHNSERKYICTLCGKDFLTISQISAHKKTHTNQRAYRCEHCSKTYKRASDIYKHKIWVHLDRSEWKYKCGFCPKRFPLQSYLNSHMKKHTNERNYLCHYCGYNCMSTSNLKRHMKSHSNVKLFTCLICSRSYKCQKSLDKHSATHDTKEHYPRSLIDSQQ